MHALMQTLFTVGLSNSMSVDNALCLKNELLAIFFVF